MNKIEGKLIDKAAEEKCRATAIGFANFLCDKNYLPNGYYLEGYWVKKGGRNSMTTGKLFERYLKTLNK